MDASYWSFPKEGLEEMSKNRLLSKDVEAAYDILISRNDSVSDSPTIEQNQTSYILNKERVVQFLEDAIKSKIACKERCDPNES